MPFEISSEIPNKKTLKAYKEAKNIKKNPKKYTTSKTVDSLMKDLLK